MLWNRRDLLKAGSLTALAMGLNAFSPAFLRRRILAGGVGSRKKLLFIFQRGGSDGVNTCIPRGDPEYSAANRPTLFIPQAQALDLGNGFAQLHPRLAPMMEIYNSTGLTGTPGLGNLAVLHRIGYSGQSQSHFDSQQYWENGIPHSSLEEGFLYRKVVETLDPENNRLAAAAISSSQMVALKGRVPIPTIRDPDTFTLAGSPVKVRKFLGTLPTAPVGTDGTGLLGIYGGPQISPEKPYRDTVYGTGLALADAMSVVQEAVSEPYTPAGGADYGTSTLGGKLRDCAMLFKRTPVEILGVNVGGWDTHTNQGQISGQHGNLLESVAQGFQALSRDLAEQWDDLVVVTMTEFGRTSRENASRGTDHAYACVVFVAGGGVRGGVYNCDASSWAPGDMFSERGRYVRLRTDFRAVFAEIFQRHFGDSMETINRVLPGYSEAAAARPGEFQFLGFIA